MRTNTLCSSIIDGRVHSSCRYYGWLNHSSGDQQFNSNTQYMIHQSPQRVSRNYVLFLNGTLIWSVTLGAVKQGIFAPFVLFFVPKKDPNQTKKTPTPAPPPPQFTSLIMIVLFLTSGLRKATGSWELQGFMEHIQYLDVPPSAANVVCVFWEYGLQGCRRMSPQQDVTLPARVSAGPWRQHKSRGDVNVN